MAKRRGVFTIIGMVAIIMIVVAGIIAVSQSFVTLAGLQLPTILTDMPTFYEYTDDGARVLTTPECNESGAHFSGKCTGASETCTEGGGTGCEAKETGYLRFYWFLAQYSLAIMIFVIGISVMEYVMSGTGFTNESNAIDRVKKVIPFLVIIMILPIIWDPVAIIIENVALYLMAPFPEDRIDIGLTGLTIDQSTLEGRAMARSAWLWMEAGHIVPPSTWDPEAWSVFLGDPARFMEETVVIAFLGVFKAYVVILLGIEMWVTGVLRVVLTMIILISIPIFLPMTLIPKFDKHASDYVNAIFGLMMAPILSAIIFTAGIAYLQSSLDNPALVRWLSAVCVCFLCSSAVTTVGGSLLMTAKGEVMGAMKTAMIAAAATISGAATGGMGAVAGAGAVGTGGMGAIAGTGATGTGGAAAVLGGVAKGAGGSLATAAQTGMLGGGGNTQQNVNRDQIIPDSAPSSKPGIGADTGGIPGGGIGGGPNVIPTVMPGSSTRSAPPHADSGYVPGDSGDAATDDGVEKKTPKKKSFWQKHGLTEPGPELPEGAKKLSFKDKMMAFGMGAIAGSAGPIMQGSLPEGFGMEKITEPLAERATNISEMVGQREANTVTEDAIADDKKDGKNLNNSGRSYGMGVGIA